MKLCQLDNLRHATNTVVVLLLLAACSGPRNESSTGQKSVDAESDSRLVQSIDSVGEIPVPPVEHGPASGRLVVQEEVVTAHSKLAERKDIPMAAASRLKSRDSVYPVQLSLQYSVASPDRENYAHVEQNPLRLVSEQPVSTFGFDVDTGAYSNVRRFLNSGSLPPQDAVRTEELINYFAYDYPLPDSKEVPFSVTTETAPAPWNPDKVLMRIGIKGFEVPAAARPAANLVFLVDVSGSMNSPQKLPLLVNALKLLTRQMTHQDRVSMVVYAGSSGVVLGPTSGIEQATILGALERLQAGGSTNGASGIRLAYQMAEQAFINGGINRVMLATDGDFNVGTVDFNALIDIVERYRKKNISLTTLGFGSGNYNDHLMEQLADAGNGNHAYIDTLNEGRKVLVEQLTGTLLTIASDVKIQV
ncbi:MAG: von Willebrand factor type A domain-containing protein, partial [Gammaproteobacteria bacterium]|nr:von Willebrand factor type A domain-containing protein [Gammaproteobacteria bacterium]